MDENVSRIIVEEEAQSSKLITITQRALVENFRVFSRYVPSSETSQYGAEWSSRRESVTGQVQWSGMKLYFVDVWCRSWS